MELLQPDLVFLLGPLLDGRKAEGDFLLCGLITSVGRVPVEFLEVPVVLFLGEFDLTRNRGAGGRGQFLFGFEAFLEVGDLPGIPFVFLGEFPFPGVPDECNFGVGRGADGVEFRFEAFLPGLFCGCPRRLAGVGDLLVTGGLQIHLEN